ncbi:MAG: GNAT family N-acetyltransferase [Planctomycetota bacterium]
MGEIRVREADPVADREAILKVLSSGLPEAASARRLDWLYLSNPDGRALVWLAEDAETGEPIGTSAGYPRSMVVDGQRVAALNLSDFAIDAKHRSLGPALKLLRASLEPMKDGRFVFSYDYPSAAMLAIYKRMGGHPLAETRRWVRMVSVRGKVKKKLGTGVVGGIATAAGDAALRARDSMLKRQNLTLELCDGEFEDLGRFHEEHAPAAHVFGLRSAAYLRWRYAQHTMWPHEALCVKSDGALIGFAFFRCSEEGCLTVTDLQAPAGRGARQALLGELCAMARARGLERVQAEFPDGTPSARMAADLGFVVREAGPGIVLFVDDMSPFASTLRNPENWWMMGGDRDI